MSKCNDIALKITVIGEYFVGKTSIVGRFVDGTFDETYSATIGFNFLTKAIEYNGSSYILNIWDTSGSERHRAVAPNYYRGTDGCLLVYDVSNPKSLEPLAYWYDEFTSFVTTGLNAATVPTLLIGNKSDIGFAQSTAREAENFAEMHNIPHHFIVSARNGNNIDAVFKTMVELCSGHQIMNFLSITQSHSDMLNEKGRKKECC
ncbi:small GTP-binding protein [Tritrichomonas foetus]|uniref:Small GTP-binding protein n=1 Tax=Tritrichomonas foetus TaxID=1144522 RepID=A0A1J4KM74_9EUKA|nr:small GTP-binding protein [Tritrichomonas foetus]|eukprot:OHT12415.1 small GTP-binding protein [Tritrichomonas foetus]